MKKPIISIIAAMDKNRGIGYKNKLPWNIPQDLARFKNLTLNHPVIMGRKTYQSILSYLNKPLPKRLNIVVSRDKNLKVEGGYVAESFQQAINYAKQKENQEIFIIGGASIYNQAIKYAHRLYLTLVKGNFKTDCYFPDYSSFQKVLEKQEKTSFKNNFTWLTLER